MRRFILAVLAPVGDMAATAYVLLAANGLAWIMAAVYLLPGVPVVEGLAFVYGAMAILGVPLIFGYAALLAALALVYRVPLGPVFLWPDRRVELLQEATV